MSLLYPLTESEQAYDALLDSLSVANHLLEAPRTQEELAGLHPELAPDQLKRHLRRLVRSGIVQERSGRYEATSSVVLTLRQGGQLEGLSEVLIPALMSISLEPTESTLLHSELHLNEASRRAFFSDYLTPLYRDLTEAANESVEYTKEQFVIIAATPDVPPRDTVGFERALEVVRNAARDRVDPEKKDEAGLIYLQARFRGSRTVRQILSSFEDKLNDFRAAPEAANYCVTLGAGSRLGPSGVSK